MMSLKDCNVDLYSDVYRVISVKLSVVKETSKLHILIPVWMIKVTSALETNNLAAYFLTNLSISLDEIQYMLVC